MVSESIALASSLVKQIKELPPVLTPTHIEKLDKALGAVVDSVAGEFFNYGCKLLNDLNQYRMLADVFFP